MGYFRAFLLSDESKGRKWALVGGEQSPCFGSVVRSLHKETVSKLEFQLF